MGREARLYPCEMSGGPLFEFDRVTVTGSSGVRLSNIEVSLPDTGITALVGPSGSGKSTFLRLCNRLELPTSGTISYRGQPMADLDPLSLRREVGMVFQKPVLFAGTVRDNLAEADGILDDDAYRAALQRVALEGSFLERPADELSGGEAQRVCLARALVASPTALLMDEPTSSLDGAAAHRLEGLAQQLAVDGIPVVWVSHDLEQVARIADHVVVVIDGLIGFTGAVSALEQSTAPLVQEFLAGAADNAG